MANVKAVLPRLLEPGPWDAELHEDADRAEVRVLGHLSLGLDLKELPTVRVEEHDLRVERRPRLLGRELELGAEEKGWVVNRKVGGDDVVEDPDHRVPSVLLLHGVFATLEQ